MRIEQKETFEPVTITFETRVEFEALIAIMDRCTVPTNTDIPHVGEMRTLARELSNWATNNVQVRNHDATR